MADVHISANAMLLDEYMVPGAGIEPARRIRPRDFKSLVSTDFTTRAYMRKKLEARVGIEPAYVELQSTA
jgi:hypothetical protein